jgi:hypothetical protein
VAPGSWFVSKRIETGVANADRRSCLALGHTRSVTHRLRSLQHLPHPGLAATILFGLAAVAYLIWLASASTHFTVWKPDDWTLIIERADPSPDSWFAAFNGHWATLLVVTYEVMLRVFGLSEHGPWLAFVTLAHIACASLVAWICGRRAGPTFGLLAGLAVLTFAQGAEDSLWPFQLGFLGAVLCGLIAIEIADRDEWNVSRAVIVSALLVASLMWSGVGLVMTIVVGCVLVLRRRPWALVLPLVAYGVWTAFWSTSYADRSGDLTGYVIRVASILGGFVAGPRSALGAPLFGVIAVVTVIAVVRGWRPQALTLAAVLGIAALYVGVGLRSGFNPDFAEPSRYRYPALVLALLATAPVIAGANRRSVQRIIPVAATIAVIIGGILVLPRSVSGWELDSLRFLAQVDAVQTHVGAVPANARFEPSGPPVAAYLGATERWGAVQIHDATRKRLADPELRSLVDEMRTRLQSPQ